MGISLHPSADIPSGGTDRRICPRCNIPGQSTVDVMIEWHETNSREKTSLVMGVSGGLIGATDLVFDRNTLLLWGSAAVFFLLAGVLLLR